MTSFAIGDRAVGDDQPCYVIAEAGSNHNGSLAQALRLIEVAAEAKADAVKFQVFRAAKLYPRSAGRSDYLGLPTSIYDVIEQMETPYEWLPRLAEHCRATGIAFLASAFDEASVDELDPYVDAHKVASYEMTHAPLLRHVAAKGKPVILSTGTANLSEVADSVDVFRATGNDSLALLQCTGAYPAPPESLDLRSITTMRSAFGLPVGLSDHSRDPVVAPVAAVALGACVIEKHFTFSNELPGPDHRFAVEPHELAALVAKVREVEAALGTGAKDVQPAEEELRSFARRSIFVTRAVAQGERFSPDNVAVLRNGKAGFGLTPDRLDEVLARAAARDLAAETALTEADLVQP
jgi:N-acetylneuraminate synthase